MLPVHWFASDSVDIAEMAAYALFGKGVTRATRLGNK
jgi:hypothetical protein